jgi:hypothetical protein
MARGVLLSRAGRGARERIRVELLVGSLAVSSAE